MGFAAAVLPFCKLFSVVSLGSHLFTVPAFVTVAGFGVTPISVVSAACFLAKHPGKPVSPAQWKQWDDTYKQYGLR